MKTLRLTLLSALLLATLALRAQAPMEHMDHAAKPKGTPSTSLMVMVAGKMLTFSPADLAAMPQKTIKVSNMHTHTDQTYTGVVLTDLLAKAGADTGKPLLRTYIKAAGTDKYWVLYSGIEIDPASHSGDTIVALTLDGQPLGENGAFQLVSSSDKKPQRWVRNLTALTVVLPEESH